MSNRLPTPDGTRRSGATPSSAAIQDAADSGNMPATLRRSLNVVSEMLAARADEHAEPPCVLCIDDDTDFIRALELPLTTRGIQVRRAHTGIDGYCVALGQPVHAILLDCQLPNGPGDYILEQLKANPQTSDIPVIVVTGRHNRELELTMLSQGAASYLHKPLNFGELMAELRKHLPK